LKDRTKLYIHASNVVGFGARTVAESLLHAMANDLERKDVSILLHLPDLPFWRENSPKADNWEVVFEPRPSGKIQRLWGRTIECLLTPAWLKNSSSLVVLGDIPIRFKGKQLVLVHNTHLISSRRSEKFKLDFFLLLRLIFRFNMRYVDRFVVQSEVVSSELALSYPPIANRIKSIPMPVPEWLKGIETVPNKDSSVFRMVYPANDYLHKNHSLIAKMNEIRPSTFDAMELKLTVTEQEFLKLTLPVKLTFSWILFEGSLDKEQMKQHYLTSDALFFPSLKESYGFPLVEAMSLGLYIICADLPYSRWMCGDQAIYFNPTDPHSALEAVDECVTRRNNEWKPDWKDALSKIPLDWVQYATEFLDQMADDN
jgi:glycosyltransferase involved in cell wall biosynthesis